MKKYDLEQSQNLKQIQRLILTPQMQQALHLLQLPILELSQIIYQEMENNPLLETLEDELLQSQDEDFFEDFHLTNLPEDLYPQKARGTLGRDEEDLRTFLENSIAYEHSLYDYLLQQAYETFLDKKSRDLAKILIGDLNAQGFLSSSLEEISLVHEVCIDDLQPILKEIQTFDPVGVGALNLQESLLIQLERQGKKNSLAFKIIQYHFSWMINNKIPWIAKALKTTPKKVLEVIEKEITRLDLHPGSSRASCKSREAFLKITPDVNLHENDQGFFIEVNEEHIPHLKLNHSYLKMLDDQSIPKETKCYIHEKIASGKWLLRNLQERHTTLFRITEEILKHQKFFFSSCSGKLAPLTMKAIAEKLSLHESTVARAVCNKYLNSPRGIFPFRYFFTNAYVTEQGDLLSSKTVKELVREIVLHENRSSPLSDEKISKMIKEKGIPCARRTVAKYRQELGIGSASQRKTFK